MASRRPFGKPSLWLLFGGGGLSVLAFVGAIVFGGAPTVRSHDADSYSRSAVGHAALVELLEASGREITRSRKGSGAKAGRRALLLLLEPPTDTDPDWLRDQLDAAHTALIALPRYEVSAKADEPAHIDAAKPLPVDSILETIEPLGIGGDLVRRSTPVTFGPALHGLTPTLAHPQLIAGSRAAPWIRSSAGGLLLEKRTEFGGTHWLLTDPTILQNHGIGDGDNAAWLLAVLDRIAPGMPIVLDEVAHGHRYTPGPLGELGRFPLVLVVVHAVLLSLFVIHAGTRRFGAARDLDRRLERGKPMLIDTTARLLQEAGRTPAILTHYLRLATRRVGIRNHLAVGPGDHQTLRAQLTRLEQRRNPTRTLAELEADVEEIRRTHHSGTALTVAGDIQRWSEEMTDGAR